MKIERKAKGRTVKQTDESIVVEMSYQGEEMQLMTVQH